MRGFSKAKNSAPLLMALALTSGMSQAMADTNPYIGEKHILNQAVRLQITPRGQKYFETRLSSILGNLGITVEEGYFPPQTIRSDKPINLEELEKKNPEAVKMFKNVRSLLTQWLTGFSLDDHRPAIEIGESGYVAKFQKFGLITDQKLMNSIGKRDGAVLAVELEISKLKIDSKGIKAWDLNNEFLGAIGFDDVVITAGSAEQPLKLRLPFYVRLDNVGRLEFTALQAEQNIDQAPIDISYKKLLVPQMGVIINNKTYYLKNEEIEKYLQGQIPTILVEVRKYIREFAEKQMPDLLNQKAKEHLNGALEQVQDMEAPGTEPGDRRPSLKWGLILSHLNLKDSLFVNLNAYVEDPVNPTSKVLAAHGSRGAPSMVALAPAQYDIALSVDRSLINRVMSLSFERKNFEKIQTCDGTQLRLVTTPLMDYVAPPAGAKTVKEETFMKLKLAIEIDPDTVFLKNKIVVSFDMITKLRKAKGQPGMELVIHSVDLNSVYLDPKYYSWLGAIVKNKVLSEVKKKLSQSSKGCGNETESKIPGTMPLPPEILGMKLDINTVQMDPNGHLVMYLDYAKK